MIRKILILLFLLSWNYRSHASVVDQHLQGGLFNDKESINNEINSGLMKNFAITKREYRHKRALLTFGLNLVTEQTSEDGKFNSRYLQDRNVVRKLLMNAASARGIPPFERIQINSLIPIPSTNQTVVKLIMTFQSSNQEAVLNFFTNLSGLRLNGLRVVRVDLIGDAPNSGSSNDCRALTAPPRGSMTCSDRSKFDSVCRFTCNKGTTMAGPSQIHCGEENLWDMDPPACIRIFCPVRVSQLVNGRMQCVNHNRYGSDCHYYCNEGYRLVGDATTTCGEGGVWTRSEQTCELIPVDCVIAFSNWSSCEGGFRVKESYIQQEAVGTGIPCPSQLPTMTEACVDCVVTWPSWGVCANGQRSRTQVISTSKVGAGKSCPSLKTKTEKCVDCKLGWGKWGPCNNGQKTKSQLIKIKRVGAGRPCPLLQTRTKSCHQSSLVDRGLVCRFAKEFLDDNEDSRRRDVLFLGDESGSIGWIEYEKIKDTFKTVASNINGGVSSTTSQFAMMSFARWTRTQFPFDKHETTDGVINGIERSVYKGGWRSNIGRALREASVWIFQQSAGMRGFPGKDDSQSHEILLVTDGCRTSPSFRLRQGLKAIKKRGIKLSVIAVDSYDPSCRGAIKVLMKDWVNVYRVGSWQQLVEFNSKINNEECKE